MRHDRADSEVERRLAAWSEAGAVAVRPELPRELSSELKKSLQAVKPLPSNRALVTQFLLVFGACATALMALLDKAGFHLMTASQMGWMAALFAGGGIYFSAQLVRRMVPGSQVLAPLGLALLPAAVGAAMTLLFPWRLPQALAEGWPCAVLELVIAAPAAAIFWAMAQRGMLFASAGLGAALTALAVFLALMVDQAQCMFPQAPHLLLWHGGMAAGLIAAGALTGTVLRRKRT